MTTPTLSVNLPKVGTLVKIECGDDTECPHPNRSEEYLKGWADFFKGGPDPDPHPVYGSTGAYDGTNQYTLGWKHAMGLKAFREAHTWTFKGAELGEDGCWYANLERQEVNSYNDVMNGSGTGLGTHTETTKVKITG